MHFGLDIATVAVVGIVGEPDLAQRRRVAPGKDRDSVEALLAVPHAAIAGGLDIGDGERVVGALQFLEADDIGLFTRQIFDQPRHAGADPIDVEGGDFHGATLAAQA